jgi:hypothetical protein
LIVKASWIGLSATSICIVEQLGLAMMPLCESSAAGFTSGTTSGIAGSIRHALELSMTMAPSLAAIGASTRLASALRREERHIDAYEGAFPGYTDFHVLAAERDGLAFVRGNVERDELGHGIASLFERLDHLRAYGAHRADDGNPIVLQPGLLFTVRYQRSESSAVFKRATPRAHSSVEHE